MPRKKKEATEALAPTTTTESPPVHPVAPTEPAPPPEVAATPQEEAIDGTNKDAEDNSKTVAIDEDLTRFFDVKLTEEEKVIYGKELADKLEELQKAKVENKASQALFKSRVETLEGEIGALSGSLRTGTERRLVNCVQEINLERNFVRIVRKDTGDIVEQKLLSKPERDEAARRQKQEEAKKLKQQELPMAEGASTDGQPPPEAQATPEATLAPSAPDTKPEAPKDGPPKLPHFPTIPMGPHAS